MDQGIGNYTSLDFKGEPVYTFLFHSNNSDVDRGGICNVNTEITGSGDIVSAKLNISIPSYLVDGNVEVKYNSPGKQEESLKAEPPITIGLPLELFTNWTPNGFSPINRGERYFNGQPIISFSFTVSKKAPRGVHKIFFTLTYKDRNNKWHRDNQIAEIHIRRFYETSKGQLILMLAYIIAALPGFLVLKTIIVFLWRLLQTFLISF
ncbi:MAG: hypothetical protein XD88_0750 [Methanocalculus sp. 52_23]|nr:MAG: hypothetical protein XD88_0750 [Methanocalculus sp. 52_23]